MFLQTLTKRFKWYKLQGIKFDFILFFILKVFFKSIKANNKFKLQRSFFL